MKKQITTAFQHDLSKVDAACGVDLKDLDKRFEKILDAENAKTSRKSSALVEALDKEFNQRELAYLFGMVIVTQSGIGSRSKSVDAMEQLLGSMGIDPSED